jgi:hypothetical protein
MAPLGFIGSVKGKDNGFYIVLWEPSKAPHLPVPGGSGPVDRMHADTMRAPGWVRGARHIRFVVLFTIPLQCPPHVLPPPHHGLALV